ncbi:MAG TPA: hypothetical protein VH593_28140 [Ktedonobacteraceae bacterium]
MSRRNKGPSKEDRKREKFEQLVKYRHIHRYTIQECAELMHVSYRTIQYWITDPLFQEAADRLREEWKQGAETRIAEMAHIAMNTLVYVMETPGLSAVAKVNAASKALDIFGIGNRQQEEQHDDRGEYERMMEILTASRPQITVNNYGAPQPGGLLPEALQTHNPFTLDGDMIVDEVSDSSQT